VLLTLDVVKVQELSSVVELLQLFGGDNTDLVVLDAVLAL
jgi:hypothetical protein